MCIIIILLGFSSLQADQSLKKNIAFPVDSVFEARKGGHTVSLSIRTRPFQKEAHQVVWKEGVCLVDGKEALGTNGGLPASEIEYIDLIFDGKPIAIPSKFYRDVFNPHAKEGSMGVRFGDDLASLFVFMAGSDGAGSYQLLWVFRSDGHHSRFSRPCPDGGFIDFYNGDLLGTDSQ